MTVTTKRATTSHLPTSEVRGMRCPWCGGILLLHDTGAVWCSNYGHSGATACTFGVAVPETLRTVPGRFPTRSLGACGIQGEGDET